MKHIEANHISKKFNKGELSFEVLKDISLSIDEGEFISIIGPSGSGKTTLLYVLSGLEDFHQGNLSVLGHDMTQLKDYQKADLRKDEVSFVFQFFNLISHFTVYENIKIAQLLSKKKEKLNILDILDLVGLKEEAHTYPNKLSGGQQQRVAIARALINQPKIIFADEPTGNLDYETGLSIMKLLKTLNETYHQTIVMVTHNMELTAFTTRTIRMLSGRIESDEKHHR